MASTRTPSANEQAKDVVLVHTVQLQPMIKAQISGRMISSGVSDVAIVSVYFEKTWCVTSCDRTLYQAYLHMHKFLLVQHDRH